MRDANLNANQQGGPPFMMAAIARSSSEPIQVCSLARPDAQPGQVLVRIQASGVNPLDVKIYAQAAAHARHPLPAVRHAAGSLWMSENRPD
jgi:NADPH:quinone reductase-like Zn-dependent oxidoreductase